ncbi:MAG: MFS transporter [Pseudomonadota bacterium]|nr:MFS transporter [Pseudomonadota bacterium]
MSGGGGSIWQYRNFVILFSTGALLAFGGRVYELALPLIVYELTQSSVAMGAMRAIEFLPNLLFAMVVGVFVDRADKKRWMLTVVALQSGLLFALYAYTQLQYANLGVFYITGFLLMLLGYAYGNAKIAAVKWALPTPLLTSANANLTLLETLVQVLGPAISGAILFLSSLYYGLLITASAFLAALLVLAKLNLEEAPRAASSRSFFWELREGWSALRNNQPMWVITWLVVFLNSTSGAFEVMLIFFAKDELRWSTALVGIVLSCAGFGGLFGSLAVSRFRERWGLGRGLAITIIALAPAYAMTAALSSPWAVGAAVFAFGMVATIQNILIWTFRHETTPAPLIGRVSGITGSIFKLGMPFAIFGAGYLADISGARSVFVVCGITQVFVFLAMFRSSLMRQR